MVNKKKKKKRFWDVQGLNIFFLVYQIFCLKKSDCPWFLFSLESVTSREVTSGEAPQATAMTGRIFQTLPTQTDTREVTSGEAPQATGNDWKNLPDTAHTDRHKGSYIWGSSTGNRQSSRHCPHRQTPPLLLFQAWLKMTCYGRVSALAALPCTICRDRQTNRHHVCFYILDGGGWVLMNFKLFSPLLGEPAPTRIEVDAGSP